MRHKDFVLLLIMQHHGQNTLGVCSVYMSYAASARLLGKKHV